jgi:hypothetical protein
MRGKPLPIASYRKQTQNFEISSNFLEFLCNFPAHLSIFTAEMFDSWSSLDCSQNDFEVVQMLQIFVGLFGQNLGFRFRNFLDPGSEQRNKTIGEHLSMLAMNPNCSHMFSICS